MNSFLSNIQLSVEALLEVLQTTGRVSRFGMLSKEEGMPLY